MALIVKVTKSETVRNKTPFHVLDAKLPISQKIIIATCSSARYFKKLMPAERIAPTMTPERISVWAEIWPLKVESLITIKRVTMAPINAKSGVEKRPSSEMFARSASEAPKAAPLEIPRVYGSASGLSKIPW
jgi:hypothetical protein